MSRGVIGRKMSTQLGRQDGDCNRRDQTVKEVSCAAEDASAANAHDGARLPVLISPDNTASGVWADTVYRSKKNEAFLAKGMFTSNIHQRKPHRRAMLERIARAHAKRSAVRSIVEHVFAGQKHRMGPVARTIGIARARTKIGMADLAYNIQRLAWLKGRTAPA